MSNIKVNLACGSTFVEGRGWINLDFVPSTPEVHKADLLERLPFDNDSVNTVYSSHFLEHIPKVQVAEFLQECFRILKPGGEIRLVLPDFEEMCREYLAQLDAGEHNKAAFVVTEIIDQCVRLRVGGELQTTYQQIASNAEKYADFVEYVRFRNGETLGFDRIERPVLAEENIIRPSLATRVVPRITSFAPRVFRRLKLAWFNWLIGQLPCAFRMQNISFASVGERHHWLWDSHQLSQVLRACGYTEIIKCQATSSRISDFPFFPLDLDVQGKPRKGAESMYIEALKPC